MARELKTLVIQTSNSGADWPSIRTSKIANWDTSISMLMPVPLAYGGFLNMALSPRTRYASDFVRSSYEYIRTLGIPQMGWFSLAGGL